MKHASMRSPAYTRTTALPWLVLLSFTLLAGCLGGEETVDLPNSGTVANSNYSGPAPATDDVQAFKRSVWDNLVSSNRCGACHSTGGQAPPLSMTQTSISPTPRPIRWPIWKTRPARNWSPRLPGATIAG